MISNRCIAVMWALLVMPRAFAYTPAAAQKIAEQSFAEAIQDILLFTEPCLFFRAECGLTIREASLLRGILMERAEHRASAILFDSEAEHPGSFLIDGRVRIAKTGNEPGGPITINRDLIVDTDASGRSQALSLPRVVSILVHELGHHFSRLRGASNFPGGPFATVSHEELDLLGSKVAQFMTGRRQSVTVGPEIHPALGNGSEIVFSHYLAEAGRGDGDYNYGSQAASYLQGPFGSVSINSSLASMTRCPAFILQGDATQGSPIGLYFESFTKRAAQINRDKIELVLDIPEAWLLCHLGDSFHSFAGFDNGVLTLVFKLGADGSISFDRPASHYDVVVPPDEEWN